MLQSFAANGVTDLKNATYEYDAAGRRIRATVMQSDGGSTSTSFVSAGHQVLFEYIRSSSGNESRTKYTYGTQIDEVLRMTDCVDTTTDVSYWLQQNKQSSPYSLSNSSGGVCERYRYDAYGKRTCLSETAVSQGENSSYKMSLAFTGRYFMSESHFVDFRSRIYSTTIGFFVTVDPLSFIDGMNLYAAMFMPSKVGPMGTNCGDPGQLNKCLFNCNKDAAAMATILVFMAAECLSKYLYELGCRWWCAIPASPTCKAGLGAAAAICAFVVGTAAYTF